jgi:hypothetical protein
MPSLPKESPISGPAVQDLLSRASSVLTREAARIPATLLGIPAQRVGIPALGAGDATPQMPAASDPDRLRRQAHELIETLLTAFSPKGPSLEEQIPLLRCVAPVQAGAEGSATMRVANEEGAPCEVALYCTNFVADAGYDIPSLRVTVSPRSVTIPPRGETAFEIKIAVPQQAPPGIYSGLIQAAGNKYVKAVLSVEVL